MSNGHLDKTEQNELLDREVTEYNKESHKMPDVLKQVYKKKPLPPQESFVSGHSVPVGNDSFTTCLSPLLEGESDVSQIRCAVRQGGWKNQNRSDKIGLRIRHGRRTRNKNPSGISDTGHIATPRVKRPSLGTIQENSAEIGTDSQTQTSVENNEPREDNITVQVPTLEVLPPFVPNNTPSCFTKPDGNFCFQPSSPDGGVSTPSPQTSRKRSKMGGRRGRGHSRNSSNCSVCSQGDGQGLGCELYLQARIKIL